jgi:hypothetical protein
MMVVVRCSDVDVAVQDGHRASVGHRGGVAARDVGDDTYRLPRGGSVKEEGARRE